MHTTVPSSDRAIFFNFLHDNQQKFNIEAVNDYPPIRDSIRSRRFERKFPIYRLLINVKFHLCSSINVRLTENSLYNRFCTLKGPLKLGFEGRGKDSWWEPPRNATTADLRVFRHVWSRSDVPCSSILHGYSRLP